MRRNTTSAAMHFSFRTTAGKRAWGGVNAQLRCFLGPSSLDSQPSELPLGLEWAAPASCADLGVGWSELPSSPLFPFQSLEMCTVVVKSLSLGITQMPVPIPGLLLSALGPLFRESQIFRSSAPFTGNIGSIAAVYGELLGERNNMCYYCNADLPGSK